jgi:hypothetical protein
VIWGFNVIRPKKWQHTSASGGHPIRHYGLFASAARKDNIARVRQLLAVPQPAIQGAIESEAVPKPWHRCPCYGHMIIIEILARTVQPRVPPTGSRPSGKASP